MKRLLFLLLFLEPLCAVAQRVVSVAPEAIFPFDPLGGRYAQRSLAPVATYVRAWREEGSEVRVSVCDTALSKGYAIYLDVVDSTLTNRVLEYLGAVEADSLSALETIETIYEFPQSRDFLTHFDSDMERIKRFFATPLLVRDSVANFDAYAPSDFSDLFHSFQLSVSGADLSIFAPTRLGAQIPEEVFVKTVFQLFPFDNQLVVAKLSGAEVRSMLEKTYSTRYFSLRNNRSDLLRHRIPAYLHASLAGVRYEVNLTAEDGRKIENLDLHPDTIYSVAMNSFQARRYKQVVQIGDYRVLMIKYLQDYCGGKSSENWSLKPQRWVREIKLREMGTIFGKSREVI